MKEIEFAIHYGKRFGEDLHFEVGKDWRRVRKLVKECEDGNHPDIVAIERWTNYWSVTDGQISDLANREYQVLYKNFNEDGIRLDLIEE